MKTIIRFVYIAVAVVILTIGAVATSAHRGDGFVSKSGTGANDEGSIHHCAPSGVRSIIVSDPSRPGAVTVPISHTRTLSNVDYVVAGVCGVGGGSGTITIAGVSGTVTHAYLYWHGINNTGVGEVYNNPIVTINGNSVTGTSLGDATTNCWGDGSSRAFEADVTAFVAGNGPYMIAGLSDCLGCNANGASLVVVFDDGNPANNRDLAFFTGNDSNIANGFPGEDDGWHATLPGIAYAGGMVKAIFHVADGQDFTDTSITFSTGGAPLTILDNDTLWDGISVPDAGTSRATNGGLWDIHTFDITAAFGPPGTTTLQLDGQDPPVIDCLGLVLMLLDLEPGSAPPVGVCPLSQGYWKNHPNAWPVNSLMLGSQTYTQAELLQILNTPSGGDASLILAKQLIAAKLNIAAGSDPTPISSTITDADSLLSGFSGKLPYHVRPSSTIGQMMVSDANTLDNYNNGLLTPGCSQQSARPAPAPRPAQAPRRP